VNATSRRLRLGGGSVIGGRAGLAVDRGALAALAEGRRVALLSGTNGKTTTTRLLAAAMATSGPVATSEAGANLPAGLVAALAEAEDDAVAVLEVDEGYLPAVAADVKPEAVVLLNLSRDQLDRVGEVRMVAERWRAGAGTLGDAVVVANADDPLVVWAAEAAQRITWVGAGQLWRSDSAGCPACGGRIEFDGHGPSGPWRCTGCEWARPPLDVEVAGADMCTTDGRRLSIDLALPGRCNLANAAMAVTAAAAMGVDEAPALAAMATVREVQGRFATIEVGAARARLLLAKNPAGWAELLDLLQGGRGPVVVGINARIADGRDPSWLWDVEFERLAGRTVIATGERAADLAVRLRYAGVTHRLIADQVAALRAAADLGGGKRGGTDRTAAGTDGAPGTGGTTGAADTDVDYVGNYTAFQQLRRRIDRDRIAPAPSSMPRRPPDAVEHRGVDVVAPRRAPAAAEAEEPARHPGAVRRSDGARGRHAGASALRVVVVHPDLLGTYGDGGNGRILAARARWRGIPVELVHADSDRPLPRSGDIYCLGGGEDGPQVHAAALLNAGPLAAAVEDGAAVLAVCAGYQVVGSSFPDAGGQRCRGVGLLDVTTVRTSAPRAVGELVVTTDVDALTNADVGWGGDRLTGFENHAAVTRLGSGVTPLGRVVRGVGNGDDARTEGARSGRVVGTYMHGPVLARNAALADLLLGLVVDGPLAPLDDSEEERLHRERLEATPAGGRPSRRRGQPVPVPLRS
jgi:CobQ-like glutamine amidotransferase family enzyme/UDP-N-acetylmuramyl tripeptide synthase